MRHINPLLPLLLALALAACDADSTGEVDNDLCGTGEVVATTPDLLCAFPRGVVIETGFECPDRAANRFDHGDVTLCSSNAELPEERQQEIVDRWREQHPAPQNNNTAPDRCESDEDCDVRERCESLACVPATTCDDDSDCGGGEYCATGIGVCRACPDGECGAPLCADTGECPPNSVCVNGVCEPVCANPRPDGTCGEPCTDDNGDGVCDDGSCVDQDADGACNDIDCDDRNPAVSPNQAEQQNDNLDNDCDGEVDEADGAACVTNADCPAGQACFDGLCAL